MNSLDTNLLFYATNEDCEEYEKASTFVQQALDNPLEWIVSDQVYFELYRLLRNPTVLEHPLSAKESWKRIDFFRHHSGWAHCCYETTFMAEIADLLNNDEFPPSRTFDIVLAITLKKHGVRRFYTRNISDFESSDMFSVIDPL